MTNPSQAHRAAVFAALRIRQRAGIALTDPASPVDIAEKLGVQVWFLCAPSLEGMLVQSPDPQILLSSLRPAGRINYTCAHELGHHWFGHTAHVDVRSEEGPLLLSSNRDERQANAFASALLMPKTTVEHGFVRRDTSPEVASPVQILAIAHWLGVGYSTLVHNLHRNVGLLEVDRTTALLRHRPKTIVEDRLRGHCSGFVLVDRHWASRPVDMQVGDVAIVEGDVKPVGACVSVRSRNPGCTLIEAVSPGTGHLDGGAGWSTYVRVRRFEFEGRSIFRHLEEERDGED